jgi:hypothetical protein
MIKTQKERLSYSLVGFSIDPEDNTGHFETYYVSNAENIPEEEEGKKKMREAERKNKKDFPSKIFVPLWISATFPKADKMVFDRKIQIWEKGISRVLRFQMKKLSMQKKSDLIDYLHYHVL